MSESGNITAPTINTECLAGATFGGGQTMNVPQANVGKNRSLEIYLNTPEIIPVLADAPCVLTSVGAAL